MAEELNLPVDADRKVVYESLLPQIRNLVYGETDFIANVSNVMAAIKEGLGFFWVGTYFVQENDLVLGPFQGPVACTRIRKGKGVCGVSWEKNETIIVPDVDKFPGHIACSQASRSEIVVPLRNASKQVIGVLDIDSIHLSDFSATDQLYLEQLAELIGTLRR